MGDFELAKRYWDGEWEGFGDEEAIMTSAVNNPKEIQHKAKGDIIGRSEFDSFEDLTQQEMIKVILYLKKKGAIYESKATEEYINGIEVGNCPECQGTGLIAFSEDSRHVCPNCDGTGNAPNPFMNKQKNFWSIKESKANEDFRPRICPACRGKGCGVCDDTGFVSKQTFEELEHIFESEESKANEYGTPLVGSWDEGGWFFGITNMTRDDYQGAVYWKGKQVDHYDHDYFGYSDDNDDWVDKMRQDAKKLERKILELEAKNIPVNMTTVLASYESIANEWDVFDKSVCPRCNSTNTRRLVDRNLEIGGFTPKKVYDKTHYCNNCNNSFTANVPFPDPDDDDYWKPSNNPQANEVDNSMDLGLLSGDTEGDSVLNLLDEQCPICGKDIDNNFMDYHMEQDHGVHSPSQYTQDTISQSMGDPNYDHLEDWRTSYGESKKIANEGMAENIWSKWDEATSGETVIWEDWITFATDEGLTDKQIQEQYEKYWGVIGKEPVVEPAEWNSLTQGETPYGLGYESNFGYTGNQVTEEEMMKYVRHMDETNIYVSVDPADLVVEFDIEWKEAERIIAKTYAIGWESKANEGMWDIFDDNGKCIECGQVISDNFEKRKAHLESHGINVEKEMNAPSNPDYDYHDYDEYIDDSDVPVSGIYESGTSDGAKKGWFDRKLANAPTIHDEQVSDTSELQNVVEGRANELDRWDEEEKEMDKNPLEQIPTKDYKYEDGYDLGTIRAIDALRDTEPHETGGFDWQEGGESEGEDEPEYYDDIPEDRKDDKPEVEIEKGVFESVEDTITKEEEDENSFDFDYRDIPEEEWDYDQRTMNQTDVEQGRGDKGTSKAEEAFNNGASAEQIYTLVDTKESEDDRTQSEDDYLTNLYNNTTANRSAGFTDI